MVQSGRGDLSYQYGVPGQQMHPTVLEAESKMIEAGLKAGKLVSVQYYPIKDATHYDIIRTMIDRGVHALNIGIDLDVIEVFRGVLRELKR
jgi:2-keto-3-deoxy-L-rhamnonate aldolase RhmA